MKSRKGNIILRLSVTLAILITFGSCMAILTPGYYVQETANWKLQSLGQDWINLLLIVPALLVTAFFSYLGSYLSSLLWAGTIFYTVYTFVIYCFALHFTVLFLLYVLILGLSFYAFTWFVYGESAVSFTPGKSGPWAIRITGIYFLVVATVFYFLWLAEIVPAIIHKETPANLADTGLIVNPVHVLDLSVVLPSIFITGLLLLKGHPFARYFSLILLCFMILMDLTIGWLSLMMYQQAEGSSGLAIMFIMVVLALFSTVLLILNARTLKTRIV